MSSPGCWRTEKEITDQLTNSESNKSTETQDSRPNFCATANNTVVNNSNAKTLIEYNIDETLDIKEEIVQDEGEYQWQKHNFRSERNQAEEKYKDGHQRGNCNLFSEKNQFGEKYITSEIYSDNNSGTKTLIEYDCDESLEIKEGIIKEQENGYERSTGEADIATVKKLRTLKKEKFQESKSEPKKKYKCKKCARSYARERSLYVHRKFECDVMPQFGCSFCGKKFKRKFTMNTHITRVHQKTDSKASETRHHCDECSRSYSAARGLSEHKRLEHSTVRSQFICDFCCFHTHRKDTLSNHINARHMPKVHLSFRERQHNCEKCGHRFVSKTDLIRHRKFACDAIPQFSCEFCGKKFKQKSNMNSHILRMHQESGPNASQTRYKCGKCFRSYSSISALNDHKRIEQSVVRSEFNCDMCGFRSKRKDNLSRHITSCRLQRAHLPIREKYKCEKCARSFFQKGNLNKHKKFECDVIPQFRCKFCGKLFKLKGNMNRHILGMHQKTDTNAS